VITIICISAYDFVRASPLTLAAIPGCSVADRHRMGWNTARTDADQLALALVVAEWTGAAPSPETFSTAAYVK